jgi:phosphorylcholine metabolism protein LicD
MKINKNNDVFINVCKILKSNNINYWVCHGTLLGIIRENRLLPWDHDIDFAVWDHEIDKEHIKSIMLSNGYEQEVIVDDMDCLHFYAEDKKIDISFYKIINDKATIKWIAPSRRTSDKLILFIYNSLMGNIKMNEYVFYKRIVLHFIKQMSQLVRDILPRSFERSFIVMARKRINYTGYSYPVDVINNKKFIKFLGVDVPVPNDSEYCLQLTYGDNWRIPKKFFIWHKDAENLIKI